MHIHDIPFSVNPRSTRRVWSWVSMVTWVCTHVSCTRAASSTCSWMRRPWLGGAWTCSSLTAAGLAALKTSRLVGGVLYGGLDIQHHFSMELKGFYYSFMGVTDQRDLHLFWLLNKWQQWIKNSNEYYKITFILFTYINLVILIIFLVLMDQRLYALYI